MTTIYLPDGQPIELGLKIASEEDGQLRVEGMLTRTEFQEIERIRNSQFFLIRNTGDETGGPAPCMWAKPNRPGDGWSHPPHAYFSYMCKERPWRGLANGLRYWCAAASESRLRSQIIGGMTYGLDDYAERNPVTGAHLKPAEPDALAWYSAVAGISVPITYQEAKRYARRINDQRPPVPFIL